MTIDSETGLFLILFPHPTPMILLVLLVQLFFFNLAFSQPPENTGYSQHRLVSVQRKKTKWDFQFLSFVFINCHITVTLSGRALATPLFTHIKHGTMLSGRLMVLSWNTSLDHKTETHVVDEKYSRKSQLFFLIES